MSDDLKKMLAIALPIGGAVALAYFLKQKVPSPPTPPPSPPGPPSAPPSPPTPPTPPKQVSVMITNFPDSGKPGELLRGSGIITTNFSDNVTLQLGIKDKPETYTNVSISVSEGENPFNFGIIVPEQTKEGNYKIFVKVTDGVEAEATRTVYIRSAPSPPPTPQVIVKGASILQVPNGYVNWGGDSHVVIGLDVSSNTDITLPTRVYAYIYDSQGHTAQSINDTSFPIKKGELTYSFDMLFKGDDTKKFAPGKEYPVGVQVFLNGKKVYENNNIGKVLIKTTPQPTRIRINKLWIEPSNPMVGQGALVHSSIAVDTTSGTTITAVLYHDGKEVTRGSISVPNSATIDIATAIPSPYVVPQSEGTHTVKLEVYSDNIKADEKSITYTAKPKGQIKVNISSVTSPIYVGSTGKVVANVYVPVKGRIGFSAYIGNHQVVSAYPSISSTGWNKLTYQFRVPVMSAGTYTFKVVVSQGGKSDSATTSIRVKKKSARISIKNITIDKTVIRPGEAYHVDFDVYNEGDISWSGEATAYLRGTTTWSLGSTAVTVSPHSHKHIRLTGIYPSRLAGQTVTVVAGVYDSITSYAAGPSVKVEQKQQKPPSKVTITNFSISPVSGSYRVRAGGYGTMKLRFNVNTSKPDNVRVHVDIIGAYGKLTSYDYPVYTGRVTSFTETISYPIPRNWSGRYTIQAKAYAVSSTGDKKYANTSWRIEVVK